MAYIDTLTTTNIGPVLTPVPTGNFILSATRKNYGTVAGVKPGAWGTTYKWWLYVFENSYLLASYAVYKTPVSTGGYGGPNACMLLDSTVPTITASIEMDADNWETHGFTPGASGMAMALVAFPESKTSSFPVPDNTWDSSETNGIVADITSANLSWFSARDSVLLADSIGGKGIFAQRALGDSVGNSIIETYAKKSEVPPGHTVGTVVV